MPTDVPDGAIVLYDTWSTRLVLFDPKRLELIDRGSTGQTFQYDFVNRQDLYTSGSSVPPWRFEVLRVSADGIRPVLQGPEASLLFPLASDRSRDVYLDDIYGTDGLPLRQQVVEHIGSSLVPVVALEEDRRISYAGVILGSELYATTSSFSSDDYELVALDLDDPSAGFRVVRTGLQRGDIYSFRGELVVDHVLASGQQIDCTLHCRFVDEAGVVVRLSVDQGDLRYEVSDPLTGEVLGGASGDLVGYVVGAAGVDIYGLGVHEFVAFDR